VEVERESMVDANLHLFERDRNLQIIGMKNISSLSQNVIKDKCGLLYINVPTSYEISQD
jgi:hypothetical protein